MVFVVKVKISSLGFLILRIPFVSSKTSIFLYFLLFLKVPYEKTQNLMALINFHYFRWIIFLFLPSFLLDKYFLNK